MVCEFFKDVRKVNFYSVCGKREKLVIVNGDLFLGLCYLKKKYSSNNNKIGGGGLCS